MKKDKLSYEIELKNINRALTHIKPSLGIEALIEDEAFHDKVAEALRIMRKNMKMGYHTFANDIGMSATTIRKIILHENPSIKCLATVIRYIKVRKRKVESILRKMEAPAVVADSTEGPDVKFIKGELNNKSLQQLSEEIYVTRASILAFIKGDPVSEAAYDRIMDYIEKKGKVKK